METITGASKQSKELYRGSCAVPFGIVTENDLLISPHLSAREIPST